MHIFDRPMMYILTFRKITILDSDKLTLNCISLQCENKKKYLLSVLRWQYASHRKHIMKSVILLLFDEFHYHRFFYLFLFLD